MADRYQFTKFDPNVTHDKILEKIVYKHGPQGVQGEIGEKGSKGDIGMTGETGPTGNKGEMGIKGDTGSRGLSGYKGEKGNYGLKGDKGENGISFHNALDGLYKIRINNDFNEFDISDTQNNGLINIVQNDKKEFTHLKISPITLQNVNFRNILNLKNSEDLIKISSVQRNNISLILKISDIISNNITKIETINKNGNFLDNEQVLLSISLLGNQFKNIKGEKVDTGNSVLKLNATKLLNNQKTDIGQVKNIEFDYDNNTLNFIIEDNSIIKKIKCSNIELI